jgi:chromosome segregation ATPase
VQISVLEAEVSDLEKELSLRDEMEAALKETLRELERAAARQQTAGQQVGRHWVCIAAHVCNRE